MSKTRYITLMGDPIRVDPETGLRKDDHPIVGGLMSHDTTVAAGVAGATVLNDFDKISVLFTSVGAIGAMRFMGEKILLSKFSGDMLLLENETLKTLCIDKIPEESASLNSVQKYGQQIHRAALIYKAIFILSLTLDIADLAEVMLLGGEAESLRQLSQKMVGLSLLYSRLIMGAYRMDKLAKGDWAIVDMPKLEPKKEKQTAPSTGPWEPELS